MQKNSLTKYISLLIIALALVACGKKTDPIAKDSLEKITPVKNFTVKARANGVYISNNEDTNLIVEKATSVNGKCSDFSMLKKLAPKSDFVDSNVSEGTKYSYRLTKQGTKYKKLSEPLVFPLTYSIPPQVLSAAYTRTTNGIRVKIKPSKPFVRMDIYADVDRVVSTGKDIATVKTERHPNSLDIVLTDKYGNQGNKYFISFMPTTVSLPDTPKNISAAILGNSLRIVWEGKISDTGYTAKVCSNVSCETYKTTVPFVTHKKKFDKCIDITVNAHNSYGTSENSTYKFCK